MLARQNKTNSEKNAFSERLAPHYPTYVGEGYLFVAIPT